MDDKLPPHDRDSQAMPERIWAGDFDDHGFGHCVAGQQGGLYEEYVRADLVEGSERKSQPNKPSPENQTITGETVRGERRELPPPHSLEGLATAAEYVRWVMHNLPIEFRMRDECPTDMLMHVLGFLYGLRTPPPPSSHARGDEARRKLSLWFFRDLSGKQRGKLFALFGLNDAQKDTNHGYQAMGLAHVVRLLATTEGQP